MSDKQKFINIMNSIIVGLIVIKKYDDDLDELKITSIESCEKWKSGEDQECNYCVGLIGLDGRKLNVDVEKIGVLI